VYKTLFSKLYINNQNIDNYSLVYSDTTPLAIYNGRIIGPIKIWSIDYAGNENNVDRFTKMDEYINLYPNNGIRKI